MALSIKMIIQLLVILIPNITEGLNNNFSYKNFDQGVFLQWSYGNDIF